MATRLLQFRQNAIFIERNRTWYDPKVSPLCWFWSAQNLGSFEKFVIRIASDSRISVRLRRWDWMCNTYIIQADNYEVQKVKYQR